MIRRLLIALIALIGAPAEELHPEDVPTPYDVASARAIQDAEACALTQPAPAFTDDQWAELVHGFAADAYTYRGGGGLPGEHRTTWTREDYRS